MVLSEEQLNIVQAQDNEIAVIGPPGTGKTRVLTERIKYLLDNGVRPEGIVAITFTNFAANEMKSRLGDCGQMFIGTMHSYAMQILLKNKIDFNIEEIAEKGNFDELIYKVLNNNLKLPRIQYLFVDEVQDLCYHEFQFINKMEYDNLFLGGDADQCIYQFKGAKPQLFNSYCRSSSTKTYTLTKNFRCGQNIIDFSSFFVANIPDHINVNVIGNLTERGWVNRCDFNEALCNLSLSKKFGSWFILTRTNAELERVGKELTMYGIPFTSFKQGDFSNEEIECFLKNDEVKLLTIHSAKGLEADNVIVVGARNWNNEEKCIEYVAATRARKLLYWCPGFSTTPKRKSKTTTKKVIGITWE